MLTQSSGTQQHGFPITSCCLHVWTDMHKYVRVADRNKEFGSMEVIVRTLT